MWQSANAGHSFATQSRLSLTASAFKPRLIVYAQTHHHPDGTPISLLPLIAHNVGITHVILAALHLNEGVGNLTLNDDHPDHPKFDTLWGEVKWLQGAGVKVSVMLGGAAKGSWERLSGDDAKFHEYIQPAIYLIRKHSLQGLDLDIEEEVQISTPIRTIRYLRDTFGKDFLITMAPTCTALLPLTIKNPGIRLQAFDFERMDQNIKTRVGMTPPSVPTLPHLSGFSYPMLMASEVGKEIDWLNAQFYCGWGDAGVTMWYDAIMAAGWPSEKIVFGVISTRRNGPGYVPLPQLQGVLRALKAKYPGFGGVMAWEYFNCGEGHDEMVGKETWEWVKSIGDVLAEDTQIHRPTISTADQAGASQSVRVEDIVAGLPAPPAPWPEEKMKALMDLGFQRLNVTQALNVTEGSVELALELLLDG